MTLPSWVHPPEVGPTSAQVPDAVVLAGGLGTRMLRISALLPKPMLPVAGRPFIEHQLTFLRAAGVRRVVLALGHLGDLVRDHVLRLGPLGLNVDFSQEQRPLGTGGALRLACQRIKRWPVLVLNGDSFVSIDLRGMLAAHRASRTPLTVALARVDDTSRFGRARVDSAGAILDFEEKGQQGPGLVNAGVYLLEARALSELPEGASSLERDVFPRLVTQGATGYVTTGYFVDIGVPDDYQRLVAEPSVFLQAVAGGAS